MNTEHPYVRGKTCPYIGDTCIEDKCAFFETYVHVSANGEKALFNECSVRQQNEAMGEHMHALRGILDMLTEIKQQSSPEKVLAALLNSGDTTNDRKPQVQLHHHRSPVLDGGLDP